MDRKTLTYVVQAEGRDQGKTFFVTEMDAFQAEAWCCRMVSALARSGVDVPPNIFQMGAAGAAALGLGALLKASYQDAKPLMDEMMTCVQFVPDPAQPRVMRAIFPGDISEMKTILLLRDEVFNLILGFSLADVILMAREWLRSILAPANQENSSTTPTSDQPSAP